MFLEIKEEALIDEFLAVFLVGDEYFDIWGFGTVGRALETVCSSGGDMHRSETFDDVFRIQIFFDSMDNYGFGGAISRRELRRNGTFKLPHFALIRRVL